MNKKRVFCFVRHRCAIPIIGIIVMSLALIGLAVIVMQAPGRPSKELWNEAVGVGMLPAATIIFIIIHCVASYLANQFDKKDRANNAD